MTPFLSRLRALDAAASKAPWSVIDDGSWWYVVGADEMTSVFDDGSAGGECGAACGASDRDLLLALRNRAARIAAALEAAATLLSRNTVAVIDPAKCVDPGAWIAVLTKNFDALRTALAALDKEEA